jgi:hypothetical protein
MVVDYPSMSSVDFGVPDVLPARWASDLCQLACYDLRDEWSIANPLIEEISTGESASVRKSSTEGKRVYQELTSVCDG